MYDPGISFYQNFPADVFCTTKTIGVCQKKETIWSCPEKVDVWLQPAMWVQCCSMVFCCNWFGSVFNGNLLQLQIENTVFNGNLLQLLMCSCFPIDLLPKKKFGLPWPLLSLASGDVHLEGWMNLGRKTWKHHEQSPARSDTLWLCQNSYWKWPFIVNFPLKMVIFHGYVMDMIRRNGKNFRELGWLWWTQHMTTIPNVFGCEKESWDPFFPFPCADEPRSQHHLVLDKAVNQRQRLCFKLLAAEKKVPPSGGVHQRNWGWGKGSRRHPMFWSAFW